MIKDNINNNYISRNYVVLFKEVRELSQYDSITDVVFGDNSDKRNKCYATLTLNLIYALIRGYKGVYLSSRKGSYKSFVVINGIKYRNPVFYDGTIDWIKEMVKNEYIIHHKGSNLPKIKSKGWVELTDKFIESIGDVTEATQFIKSSTMKSQIILRDSKTKIDKEFKMTPSLELINTFITNYNKALNEQSAITLYGEKVNTDIHRLYIDKIGNYGRFHSDVVNMKKDLRKDILIDGERTCEVDLVASHLSILYAESGEDITTFSDPYDLKGYITNEEEDKVIDYAIDNFNQSGEWYTERDIYKTATVVAINTNSMSQAINTLAATRGEFGKVVKGDRLLIKGLLDAISKKHYKVCEHLFKSQTMRLMSLESEWILDMLVEVVGVHGIPILPIHDGFVCERSEAVFIKETMQALFFSMFGGKCLVKIKD